jgi:ATP-dependent protease HslVU (ClpYQ) peptidase subunit
MTTIAWDGTTLAADRRATLGSVRMTVCKIGRGRDGNLVGVSGTAALIEAVLHWLCEGGERPEGQDDKGDFCAVLEVTAEGEVYRHERLGRFRVLDRFFAVGSGADFAMAAMHCGRTAAEAVAVAAHFDTMTGDGVDSLDLRPPGEAKGRRRAAQGSRAR